MYIIHYDGPCLYKPIILLYYIRLHLSMIKYFIAQHC